MSLDTGTFSGNQKLPVSRSQTSASFSSCKRFQLMAETRSIRFIPSDTRTPFRRRSRFAGRLHRHYPWGATMSRNTTSCVATDSSPGSEGVAPAHPEECELRGLELAHVPPVFPGHAAPQRPVDAVLIEIPATAAARVPDGVTEVLLQCGVVAVLGTSR